MRNSSSRKTKRRSRKPNDTVDWQRVFDFGKKEAAEILRQGAPARVFAQAFQDVWPWAFDQATTFEDAFTLAYTEAFKEACEWLHLR